MSKETNDELKRVMLDNGFKKKDLKEWDWRTVRTYYEWIVESKDGKREAWRVVENKQLTDKIVIKEVN